MKKTYGLFAALTMLAACQADIGSNQYSSSSVGQLSSAAHLGGPGSAARRHRGADGAAGGVGKCMRRHPEHRPAAAAHRPGVWLFPVAHPAPGVYPLGHAPLSVGLPHFSGPCLEVGHRRRGHL